MVAVAAVPEVGLEWDWRQSSVRTRGGRGGGCARGRCVTIKADGVEIMLLPGSLPVVDLDKTSIFHENASWLLQTATGSTGKADGCYDYCTDNEILRQCQTLGFTSQDVFIARLKPARLKHIKAVGVSGKRSVMLACVVALLLQEEIDLDALHNSAGEYESNLQKPLDTLIRNVMRHARGGGTRRKKDGGQQGEGGQSSRVSLKRSREDRGSERGDDNGWSKQESRKSGRPSGPLLLKRRKEEPGSENLDKQLDDYWGDDR